jgi:hypothetical protein
LSKRSISLSEILGKEFCFPEVVALPVKFKIQHGFLLWLRDVPNLDDLSLLKQALLIMEEDEILLSEKQEKMLEELVSLK